MPAGSTSRRLCRCYCTLQTSATLQSAGSCTTAGRRLSWRSFSSRWVGEVVQQVAAAAHSWPGVSHALVCFQGDKEAELGLPFSPLCDRKSTMVAQSQIGELCTSATADTFRISAFSCFLIYFSCCFPGQSRGNEEILFETCLAQTDGPGFLQDSSTSSWSPRSAC